MKRSTTTLAITLVATALLAACTGEQGGSTERTGEPSVPAESSTAASATSTPVGAAADTMAGMAGMPGMSGMSGMGDGKMSDMHPHMTMMEKASPDSMKAMLPAHRQMVANMLSQMSAEMRKMNMPADAAFTAIGDSLRQDLVRMPDLPAAELARYFPAHHARMMRYMKAHEQMMKGMKM